MTDDRNRGDSESLIFGATDGWFNDDDDAADPSSELPHWTEPAPGGGAGSGDSSFASVAGPRWRGSGADFDDVDDVRIFAETPSDPVPPPASLIPDADAFAPPSDSPPPFAGPSGGLSDGAPDVVRITDDSLQGPPPVAGHSYGAPLGAVGSSPVPSAGPGMGPGGPSSGPVAGYGAPPPPGPGYGPPPGPGGPGPGIGYAPPSPPASGRDLVSAVGVGALLAAVAAGALFLGPLYASILVAVVLFLATAEFYNATRQVGYDPATFAGVAFAGFLPLAIYWRGLLAYPIIGLLVTLATLLWYLFGASASRPIANIAMTILGFAYVGLLGSFAVLILRSYSLVDGVIEQHGTGMFLAAVLCTVAYDVGAYFSGRAFGRTPMSALSPNKTLEGLAGGVMASVLVALLIVSMTNIPPWGDKPGGFLASLVLGFVVAAAATLGDLSESMLKRDMGVKDMGSILPGHGGILDRFDSLLFVLPATWCAGLLMSVIEAPF